MDSEKQKLRGQSCSFSGGESSRDVLQEIQNLLDDIERRKGVTIFHAVESGSRAWGFPSADSDYDIRFLYHHEQTWYLTAFQKKDQLDLAFVRDLDAGGWDIGKCLRLLYKGNAVLHEWLNSPVVYRSDTRKTELLRHLAARVFNPKAACYHYLSLAKKKLLTESTRLNAKSFLYALRALLCAKWIVDERQAPLVEFAKLVERYVQASEISAQLVAMLEQKAVSHEREKFPVPELLWDFAERIYSELQTATVKGCREGDINVYDRVLREFWQP